MLEGMLTKPYVRIRPVLAAEAGEVVDAVFESLSDESRRLRFHVPMPRLPTSFRDQLARIDGRDHAAVAAWIDGRPVGVGRLVALTATDCEMALAVADQWQGRGIGRSILGELIDLARRLGYTQLIADVLVENAAMLALVCDVFPDAECKRERGIAHLRCNLVTARRDRPPRVPEQRMPMLA